jgi:hypothetical protein
LPIALAKRRLVAIHAVTDFRQSMGG